MIRWDTFLALAVDLEAADTSDPTAEISEARLRSAVSRSYYTVFHAARDLAGMPKAGHSTLHNHFIDTNDPTLMALGRKLKILKICRISADYDSVYCGRFPQPTDLKNSVQFVLVEAEDLLETLSKPKAS